MINGLASSAQRFVALRKRQHPISAIGYENSHRIVDASSGTVSSRWPRVPKLENKRGTEFEALRGMVIAERCAEASMKKILATLITLVVLSMAALPVAAQTRSRCANRSTYNGRYSNRYDTRYDGRYRTDTYRGTGYRNDRYDVYQDDNYVYGDNRSVWQRHRDKITTAGGAAGGAVIGGLIGGKKGAVIGAITGGAGAAIYTYKIRDRYRRY